MTLLLTPIASLQADSKLCAGLFKQAGKAFNLGSHPVKGKPEHIVSTMLYLDSKALATFP